MKNFRAADKTHAGGDEKHDINFHWPYAYFIKCAKNDNDSIFCAKWTLAYFAQNVFFSSQTCVTL